MIDTHQHLLYADRFNYSWTRDIPALQGAFELEDYRQAAAGCGITGSIFMEVDVDAGQAAGEAEFFCHLAEEPTSGILGVIAAGRPEHAGFEAYLDATAHPKLVGIRRVLHTQPDELSQSTFFRENIRLLDKRGLPFDLCVLQRQLPLALDLVQACPDTIFVLDHCGVPDIANNDAPDGDGFKSWQAAIRSLAAEPNTFCKISGLTAYAAEGQRTPDGFRPYFDTVLDAFGSNRCMWGGDWPVVNLGSGLAAWCDMTASLLSGLSDSERSFVFQTNACALYNLQSKNLP